MIYFPPLRDVSRMFMKSFRSVRLLVQNVLRKSYSALIPDQTTSCSSTILLFQFRNKLVKLSDFNKSTKLRRQRDCWTLFIMASIQFRLFKIYSDNFYSQIPTPLQTRLGSHVTKVRFNWKAEKIPKNWAICIQCENKSTLKDLTIAFQSPNKKEILLKFVLLNQAIHEGASGK